MSETVATSRYLAIDFFRGLTIALMIIVNTPGDWEAVFAPLRHAEWHGCTLADWIFPFFLYIVGVSAWFSFEKYHQKLSPVLARKILRRAGLIFLIGVALNAYPFVHTNWPELRIMGVMQRIGLAYGLAAFLCLSLNKKQLVIASGLLLAGYWAALWFGGTGDPYSIETNLVRQIDIAVLGAAHLNHGISIPFESEGLLSTLPAVVTVVIGYLTGGLIANKKQDKKKSGVRLIEIRTGAYRYRAGVGCDFSHYQTALDELFRALHCRAGNDFFSRVYLGARYQGLASGSPAVSGFWRKPVVRLRAFECGGQKYAATEIHRPGR